MQYQVAIPLGASTCKKIPWKRTGRYVLTASPPSICEVRNTDALIDTIEDPDDNIIRLRFLPFHTPMTVFVKVKVRPAPRGGRGGGASSSRGGEVEVGDVGGGGGDGGEVKGDAASDAVRPGGEVKEGGGEGGAPPASLVGGVETLVFKVVYADLGLPSAAEKAAEAEWGNIAECTGFSHAQVRQMHQRFIIDTRGGHAMSRAVFGRVMASLGAVVPMPDPPPPSPPPRAASDRDSGGDARADGDGDGDADGVGDGDGDGMGDRADVDENNAGDNAEDNAGGNAKRVSLDAASPLSVARTYTAFTAVSDRRTEQLWQWFTRHGPNLTFSELAAGLAITWTQADDDADAAMAVDEAERYEERERERECVCVCVYADGCVTYV